MVAPRSAALAVLLSACGASEQEIAPDGVADVTVQRPPASTVERPPLSTAKAEPRSSLDGWTLPQKQGPALGGACPPPPQAESASPPPCGTRGRVSLEYQPRVALDAKPPCDLRSPSEDRAGIAPELRSLCADGDLMVVTNTCVMCRMPNVGSAVLVRLSELTPEQHRFLHGMLRLREEKPESPDAWRAFIARSTKSAGERF